MALSDYSTAVEKIAALKAATLDPSICNMVTNNTNPTFNVTEDIHIFYNVYALYKVVATAWKGLLYSTTFSNPINIMVQSGDEMGIDDTCLYVKDSDISYSDPVTTYQDRLNTVLNTVGTDVINPNTFTTGVNGSIILVGSRVRTADGNHIIGSAGLVFPIPVPDGVTFHMDSPDMCTYFDVPADW